MPKSSNLFEKVIRALIYGRFDPIETVLAVFITVLGVWVAIREINTDISTTFFGSGTTLLVTAIVFAAVGLFHLLAIDRSYNSRNWWTTARINSMFFITVGFLFSTMETMLGLGINQTRWMPWAALTFISAFTYLALAVKR